MLLNYLKIAFKALWRRKFFTAISLFGITVTLAVLLVVAAIGDHMLAPMAPEVNLDRTLHVTRVIARGTGDRGTMSINGSPGYKLLDLCARELPGAKAMSIYSESASVTGYVAGEKLLFSMRHTDGSYWEILDFDFLEGGPFSQDDDDQANFVAVISEATRRKFFGNRPALGETIEVDGQRFRVIGTVRDVSATRQAAQADIWVPHGTAKSQEFREDVENGPFGALILARSRADFDEIRAEFESRLLHVELTPPFDTLLGTPLTRFEQIVLGFDVSEDAKPKLFKVLLIWAAMAGAFLLLPTLNLVSINLTRILERSGEIGVRKAFGASSSRLVGQFVFENVVLCLIGSALALLLAGAVIELVESSGWVPYSDLRLNHRLFLYAAGLACLFGVISGAFPAWRMSRLHPVAALRGGER